MEPLPLDDVIEFLNAKNCSGAAKDEKESLDMKLQLLKNMKRPLGANMKTLNDGAGSLG